MADDNYRTDLSFSIVKRLLQERRLILQIILMRYLNNFLAMMHA